MSWLTILGLAVGLAMDAFAVAIAAAIPIRPLTGRHIFRLSFHFGLFQFMMPVLGWLVGSSVAAYISRFDHWVAAGLLAVIGGKMLHEAWAGEEAERRVDMTRGLMLVTLSVATSIDALAVGLSMAFLEVSIWVPSVVIGIVAATLTAVGMRFGSRLGKRFGRAAEALGGVVLLGIGVRVLVSHLSGGG